jgi:hypothetical protein
VTQATAVTATNETAKRRISASLWRRVLSKGTDAGRRVDPVRQPDESVTQLSGWLYRVGAVPQRDADAPFFRRRMCSEVPEVRSGRRRSEVSRASNHAPSVGRWTAASRENLYSAAYGRRTRSGAWRGQIRRGAVPG